MRKKIKAIKQKFLLSMNGVVSQNMRDHGMNYKVNFGLTLPLLKRIAQETDKNATLAQALWEEKSVRESMMLAPLLYPVEAFTGEDADNWVTTLPNTEVADMCSKYLFAHTPFVLEKSAIWCKNENALIVYTGFQSATAWLMNHPMCEMTPELYAIIHSAIENSSTHNHSVTIASLNFLKQAMHHNSLAQYILNENNMLPENLSALLVEERELFLEFAENNSH